MPNTRIYGESSAGDSGSAATNTGTTAAQLEPEMVLRHFRVSRMASSLRSCKNRNRARSALPATWTGAIDQQPKLQHDAEARAFNGHSELLEELTDRRQFGDEYISTEHYCWQCWITIGSAVARLLNRMAHRRAVKPGAQGDSRRPASHRPKPGGQVPGAREVRT